MSVQSEIERLNMAKGGLKSAIENGGVSVGANVKLDAYPDLVNAITEQICTQLDTINGEVF